MERGIIRETIEELRGMRDSYKRTAEKQENSEDKEYYKGKANGFHEAIVILLRNGCDK